MILDKIYISSTEPIVTNVLWAKPLDGGAFSLYAFLSGKWGLLKLMRDNGTPYPDDDTPGGSADDCYTKEEIDERFADILGLDAEGIAELKALIEDEDSLTGLLSEIARKANAVLLSAYIDSDDPLPTDCIYKRIVGGSGREFKYLLPKEVKYSGDSYLIFRIPDDTDESFAYIVFKREHRTTTMQYYYNASYNTSTDEVPAWVEDAFGYTRSEANNLLSNKVDKVTGKGLSTNDYTTAEKTKLGALPTNEELTQALGGKANKVPMPPVVHNLVVEGSVQVSDVINLLSGTFWAGAYTDITSTWTNTTSIAEFSTNYQGVLRFTALHPDGKRLEYIRVYLNDVLVKTSSRDVRSYSVSIEVQTNDIIRVEFTLLNPGDYFSCGIRPLSVSTPSEPMDLADVYNSLAPVATSGSYNDLSDKPDLSAFITKSVNDLTNYYLKSETYTKTEVQQLIGAIQQFHYEVYPTLPQTGASNVLYLIGPTGTGADKYEEYVYANNTFTKIGDTSIDLSGYVTTQALTTALADYVTSSALSTTLLPIYNRLEDVEEALTETLPVESFIMDDYSIGSETITGTNISSNGTVPIKECRLPYVSEPTITIDGVTYSKAIRKDFTTPYTDGVLAEFDFEEKGTLMVYYGFGGGGSYGTYYLQFYFTSDDGTITDELLASRDVFDTAREIDKLSITIPKKGTLTIRAWDNVEGHLEDNGYSTNIVRIDFTTTSLINVSALKTTKADKSEMSVVPGTGANADKTTITLKQGASATVLTAHQDISGKENMMPITTATGATLSAVVGNYYRLDNVGTLTITLPTTIGATKLQAITFLLVCGSSALVTFAPQGSETILYQEDFALEADTTYEVTALWNGSEWTLSRVIYE